VQSLCLLQGWYLSTHAADIVSESVTHHCPAPQSEDLVHSARHLPSAQTFGSLQSLFCEHVGRPGGGLVLQPGDARAANAATVMTLVKRAREIRPAGR
jgi:hypothetical protein